MVYLIIMLLLLFLPTVIAILASVIAYSFLDDNVTNGSNSEICKDYANTKVRTSKICISIAGVFLTTMSLIIAVTSNNVPMDLMVPVIALLNGFAVYVLHYLLYNKGMNGGGLRFLQVAFALVNPVLLFTPIYILILVLIYSNSMGY